MSDLYSTRADVNRWIPDGAITRKGRIAESSKAASDVITLDGHGLETNDPLTVRAADGGSLPTPLVEDTTYYAIRITNAKFSVAAAPDGSAINLTTDGVSLVVVKEPDYDRVIGGYSRLVDSCIPHLVPLTQPIPELVVMIVSKLSAKELMALDGKQSAILDQINDDIATKMLERWAKGLPVREATVTASSNLAVVAQSSSSSEFLP